MKKALLVIDAQEDFIGEQRNKNKFNYEDVDELIKNINDKITIYKKNKDEVIYIANVLANNFFYNKFFPYGITGSKGAKIDKRIKIVSENYFEKQVGNAFKNNNLVKFIKENQISEVELIGVDGIGCVFKTAKGAMDIGLKVTILSDSVGTVNPEKFIKLSTKLKILGVYYM
ncbi:isochorismatase family protein [Clostridium puniceum]|uniref:Isochorismatase family protein n=1 Tax=Clostridium puniceum TaxID=29367 RepID=A0A1S8TFM4_9CLOT|nr:isochorismatase family cysteine hydrolase [Clostridium puniceum]OOM76461.1 isochorismatase family protein [Clostridium puniceum]